MDRRAFLFGSAAAAASIAPLPAFAVGRMAYEPGTIVISVRLRTLFLITGTQPLAWPVAVGKAGKLWTGETFVASKHINPPWSPPSSVRRDVPGLPDVIPGGAANNPLGARALLLAREEIAIHGTTAAMRRSIGSAASYGCIRMHNEHIVELFEHVAVGTRVIAV